eukprot:7737581-Lingulodinium_polyedra.AAC.1
MEKDMDFQEELMQVDECMELMERSDQKSMEKAKQACKDIEVERQLFTEAYSEKLKCAKLQAGKGKKGKKHK